MRRQIIGMLVSLAGALVFLVGGYLCVLTGRPAGVLLALSAGLGLLALGTAIRGRWEPPPAWEAPLGLDMATRLIQSNILIEGGNAIAAQQIKEIPARNAQEFRRATR